MDVSVTGTSSTSVQAEVIKKDIAVQGENALKVSQNTQEQSQNTESSQKTGKGISLDAKA